MKTGIDSAFLLQKAAEAVIPLVIGLVAGRVIQWWNRWAGFEGSVSKMSETLLAVQDQLADLQSAVKGDLASAQASVKGELAAAEKRLGDQVGQVVARMDQFEHTVRALDQGLHRHRNRSQRILTRQQVLIGRLEERLRAVTSHVVAPEIASRLAAEWEHQDRSDRRDWERDEAAEAEMNRDREREDAL